MREEWYTTVEVARLLGRSDRFVRDRVKTGELPAVAKQNEKRASYKISREALMGFLLGSERKSVKEVAEVLKDADEWYLKELEEVIAQVRAGREGDFHFYSHGEGASPASIRLEHKRLKEEFVFADPSVYERYRRNPLNFTSTLVNKKTGEAEAHFGVEVTTVKFFEDLCAGRARDDYQPPWTRGETPIFYVDVLIVEDPLWTPFLFRHMARNLKNFMRREGLQIKPCFTVASAPEAVELCQRYGFLEVGRYEGKYPIMLNRDITAGRMGAYLR